MIFIFPLYISLCRGVTAISFPKSGRLIYTAGADGMVCELDTMSGNLLQKFKASTKGITSMSVSSGLYFIYNETQVISIIIAL